MISTRPRRHHGRRVGQLAGRVAVVTALVVGATGCNGTPSRTAPTQTPNQTSAPTAPPTPTPSDTGRAEPSDPPTVDPAELVKVDPPPKPDLRIWSSRDRFPFQMWTGPWRLDLARLTLVSGRHWVTVKLHFSRMQLDTGDFLEVRLEPVDGSPPRTLGVSWGPGGPRPGEVRGAFGMWFFRCGFEPRVDRAHRTLIMRVRRDRPVLDGVYAPAARRCLPREPMRAHGDFMTGEDRGWYAIDLTAWTDYASLGETVAVADPAK